MDIAVAGGTGTVGRHVVRTAREKGHHVVSLSRAEGVDLTTGKGLGKALKGVDTVIDVSGIREISTKKNVDFFTSSTQNLLAAEKRAGVKHHVVLSIVGLDKAPSSVYAGKRAQEEAVRHGDVPWTILRSTQFHEFVPMELDHASAGPLAVVPRMLTQPVAASEVAKALVDAAEAGRADASPIWPVRARNDSRTWSPLTCARPASTRSSCKSRSRGPWAKPCAAVTSSRSPVPPSGARRSSSGWSPCTAEAVPDCVQSGCCHFLGSMIMP